MCLSSHPLASPVPPILSTPLPQSPQTPIFGDPLSLTCGVDNTLVSQWIWYHNGQQLIETTDNTLTIEEVDSTIHNGIYQCFAYNTAGNISSATSVEVTSKRVCVCVCVCVCVYTYVCT